MSNFFEELKRRKVFRTTVAYAVVAFIIMQIVEIVFPMFDIPNWAGRFVIILLFLGLPIAIILSWMFDTTEKGIVRTKSQMSTGPESRLSEMIVQDDRKTHQKKRTWFAVGGILLGILIGWYVSGQRFSGPTFYSGERIPVAVADFINDTGEKSLDGLSGMLLTSLEQSQRLSVLTRSRMFDILKSIGKTDVKNVDESTGREICAEADINALVLTSIRKFGDLYTIDLKVLNPNKNEYILTTKVEGKGQESIPGLIDELSEKTRLGLNEKAEEISSSQTSVADMTTTDLDAYQYYFEGNDLMFKLEFGLAVENFQKAVAIDPTFASAYSRLAYALRWNSLPGWKEASDKAIQYIDKAPKKEKYFIRALNVDRVKEIAIYEEMLKLYPDEKIAIFEIGDINYHYGNIEGSIPFFEKVLELDPSFEWALQHITWAHRDIDDTKGMIQYAQTHVDQSSSKRNYNDLIWAYISDGQFDKGLEIYDQARSLFPGSTSIAIWKGIILDLIGKYNEAEQAFRSLIDPINSQYKTAVGYKGLFWHYMLMGQFEKADKYVDPYYNILIDLDKKVDLADHLSQMSYGYLVLQLDESIARELLVIAEDLGSPSSRFNRFMSSNYALLGEKEKAMSFSGGIYEQEELVDAFVAISEHEYNAALKYLLKREKSMASFRKDNIRYQLAMCYINLKQFSKAEKYLQGVLSMKGDYTSFENTLYPITYYWLGVVNEELGKDDLAIQHYKQFLHYWKNADATIPELIDTKKRFTALKKVS